MDTIDKINYYLFLLTPLREGRHADVKKLWEAYAKISTHAPAGGATVCDDARWRSGLDFYSRPCGRGDSNFPQVRHEVLRQIAER